MPLYEYRCLSCEHVFDAIQKFSDPPLTDCPECGKNVEKCVSTPALQFKGSGFYITDYTKATTSTAGGKAGGDKKPENTPTAKKTEAKKAAPKKPEAKKAKD